MDVEQAIALRLHRELAKLGVEFAYPTQRLLIAPPGPQGADPNSAPAADQAARSAACSTARSAATKRSDQEAMSCLRSTSCRAASGDDSLLLHGIDIDSNREYVSHDLTFP